MFKVTLSALTTLRTKLHKMTNEYVKQQREDIKAFGEVKKQADQQINTAEQNIKAALLNADE